MSGLAAVHCNQHPYMLISSCIRNKCAWVVRCKCLIEYNALRGGADGIDPVHGSNWPIRPTVFEKNHTGTPMVTLETQRNDPKSVTEPPSVGVGAISLAFWRRSRRRLLGVVWWCGAPFLFLAVGRHPHAGLSFLFTINSISTFAQRLQSHFK